MLYFDLIVSIKDISIFLYLFNIISFLINVIFVVVIGEIGQLIEITPHGDHLFFGIIRGIRAEILPDTVQTYHVLDLAYVYLKGFLDDVLLFFF